MSAPSLLSYPLLHISGLGPGGPFVAALSFSASPIQIPEPPGWLLAATALLVAGALCAARDIGDLSSSSARIEALEKQTAEIAVLRQQIALSQEQTNRGM